MTLTTLITLTLAALALGLGWMLGGQSGLGVFTGFAAAASVAGLALLAQRRLAQSRPAYLMHAALGGFLVKAFALLGFTALVRFVPALAERLDWFAFALAFGVTTLVLLVPATLELLQQLKSSPLRTGQEHGA